MTLAISWAFSSGQGRQSNTVQSYLLFTTTFLPITKCTIGSQEKALRDPIIRTRKKNPSFLEDFPLSSLIDKHIDFENPKGFQLISSTGILSKLGKSCTLFNSFIQFLNDVCLVIIY